MPVNSQDLSLAVFYLHGEKSKDNHSTEESIALSSGSLVYSVKFFGKSAENRSDENVVCDISENETEKIKNDIIQKGLNKNDSLFADLSKSKSYEVYCNINISISMDGYTFSTRVNGDVNELMDLELYKNTVSLVSKLRKLIRECK